MHREVLAGTADLTKDRTNAFGFSSDGYAAGDFAFDPRKHRIVRVSIVRKKSDHDYTAFDLVEVRNATLDEAERLIRKMGASHPEGRHEQTLLIAAEAVAALKVAT